MSTVKGFMLELRKSLIQSSIMTKSIQRLNDPSPLEYERLIRRVSGEWVLEFFFEGEWHDTFVQSRSLENALMEMTYASEEFPNDPFRVRNKRTRESIPGEVLQKA